MVFSQKPKNKKRVAAPLSGLETLSLFHNYVKKVAPRYVMMMMRPPYQENYDTI